MEYPTGLDPYVSRQHLLHHTYSPLISLQSSRNADILVKSILDEENITLLQLLKPYGNNARYSIPNQSFKVINTQLITKSYPSFPIRFEPPLPELLSMDITSAIPSHTKQLFSISSLEILLKHMSHDSKADLYLNLFNKVITSNKVVPFETFNHPIAQIFFIDYENDSLEYLRKAIVEFRNFNFPKYFQINDLLIHAFVLYDTNKVSNNEIGLFQKNVRSTLNIHCSAIPIVSFSDDPHISMPLNDNSTIEEDLQRITLKHSSQILKIPKSFDSTLRNKLYDFINKSLIPHMQSKIRIWDDQVLQPKKSITNKFFSASKKLFNNESNSSSSFNYQENYYSRSSPEQAIRKLADWSLILKDFKYAYSTYDLIKKDYTNDRAWTYVASIQEMCIVSLLLAQTQQSSQITPPDKNMLRKIRHDIIEPYFDNLSYTFKSRLDLKTYSIKTLLIIIELLICMSLTFNISWWWNDLIEKYLCKCINEFDNHLMQTNQKSQVIRAILYERLGFSFGQCTFLNNENRFLIVLDSKDDDENVNKEKNDESKSEAKGQLTEIEKAYRKNEEHDGNNGRKDDGNGDGNENENENENDDGKVTSEVSYYHNPYKLEVSKNNSIAGLTRFRKSAIWYLLSMKEWYILKNRVQIKKLLDNIRLVYATRKLTKEWYDRDKLLLGFVKRHLKDDLDVDS